MTTLFIRPSGLGGEDERNDQTVETQGLSEDENQNHADEQLRLLCCGAHTRVTDDADGHAGSETSETDRETRAEVSEALEVSVGGARLNCKGGGAVSTRLTQPHHAMQIDSERDAPSEATMTAIMRP